MPGLLVITADDAAAGSERNGLNQRRRRRPARVGSDLKEVCRALTLVLSIVHSPFGFLDGARDPGAKRPEPRRRHDLLDRDCTRRVVRVT